jgi:hypothetical protein
MTPPLPVRTHLLSIGIARHVFTHQQHGIVFVRDAITLHDARAYGLKPVVLYAVSVLGTPIMWLGFGSPDALQSLRGQLIEAWRSCPQLRGYPDVLRISHQLAASCQRLQTEFSSHGIKVEVAASDDRKFSAALRSAQNSTLQLGWSLGQPMPQRTLAQLQKNAADVLTMHEDLQSWRIGGAALVETTRAHLALPVRPFTNIELGPESMDWSSGPWMSAWEKNLPPERERSFHTDDDGKVWLFFKEPDEHVDASSAQFDMLPGCLNAILPCWPNGAASLARAAGLTLKKLQWFIADRQAIDQQARHRLMTLVGIEMNAYREEELAGGCVLAAGSLRATVRLYDELTHGGDVTYAFEILPVSGSADPSWRYVLIEACGCLMNVLMVPRGGDVSAHLDADHFINLSGQCDIPDALYTGIVGTCGRACIDTARNRSEMMAYLRQNYDRLVEHLPSRW